MARLVQDGAEHRVAPTATANPIGSLGYIGPDTNKPTIDTAGGMRGLGTAAWKATLTLQRARWTPAGALSTDYWSRMYFILDAQGLTGTLSILEWQTSANVKLANVRINNGTLTLNAADAAGTNIGSASAALSTGVWYCLETHIKVTSGGAGDDTFEAWLDGVQFVSTTTATLGTAAPNFLLCGPGTLTGSVTIRWDDVAINDSAAGTGQTGRCGPGSIVHLQPVSDNARTNWVAGQAGTTNLWDAVNNSPPAGLADANATITSQVRDATANTTDTYVANINDYTTAGVRGVVKTVEGRGVIGHSGTTSRNVGVAVTSNPTIAEVVTGSGTTAAGIYPLGWTPNTTGISHAPSITPGTDPVMTLRRATGSAANAQCCAMFLVVDFSMELPLATAAGIAVAGNVDLAVPPVLVCSTAAGVAVASPLALRIPAPLIAGTAAGVATATLALFAAPPLIDDFNRGDGALGANWTTPYFGDAVAPTIVSGEMLGPVSGVAGAYYNVRTYGAPLEFSIEVGSWASDVYVEAAVADANIAGNTSGYGIRARQSDLWVLYKWTAGVGATLASGSWTHVTGTLKLRIAANGDVTALMDDVVFASVNDPTPFAGPFYYAVEHSFQNHVDNARASGGVGVPPATLVPSTAVGVAIATATLTVAPKLVCGTSAGVATATVSLTVAPKLVCATATGVASTRNIILAQWAGTAVGVATGTLALTIPGSLTLSASTGVAAGGNVVLKTAAPMTLGAAVGVATTSATLKVAPKLVCGTAVGVATTSMTLLNIAGGLYFIGDFETGDLSQWPYLGDANGCSVVSSPTFDAGSNYAMKCETTNAPDSSSTGDASYVEQNSFALPWENPPADVWHRAQYLFPSSDATYPGEFRGFSPGTPGAWNMFMEWHNQAGFGPGSSYVGSITNGDGTIDWYLRLWGGDEMNPTSRFFHGPPLVKDVWHDVLVRIKFSDIGLPDLDSLTTTDAFNVANVGPPISSNWGGPWDGYPGQLKVVSNAAVSSNAGGAGSYWIPTVGTPAGARVKVSTLPGTGEAVAIAFIDSATSPNGYAVSYHNNGLWRIYKITGGVWTAFVNINITHAISAGDTIGIMVDDNGYIAAMLKHLGSWTEILNTTDLSYSGPFQTGLEMDGQTAVFDDFATGTLVAPSDAGYVEWWVDGTQYYSGTFPVSWRDTNNSNGGGVGGCLFDVGHYRITETPSWTDTIYVDGVRVGPTKESVLTASFLSLGTAVATGTATLALKTGAPMTLSTAAGVAAGTLTKLTTPAPLTCSTAVGVGTTTASLRTPAPLTASTATGVGVARNVLLARWLDPAVGVATATLALRVPASLTASSATGVATATLSLTVAPKLVCSTAVGVATTTASLTIASTAFTVTVTDTVALADSFTPSQGWVRAIADTPGTADDLAMGVGAVVGDAVTLNDAATTQAILLRTLQDTVTLSDAQVVSAAIALLVGEAIALSDLLSTVSGHVRTIIDSVGVSDTLLIASPGSLSFDEEISFEDAQLVRLSEVAVLADTVNLVDALERSYGKHIGEGVPVLDSFKFGRSFVVADVVTVIDALRLLTRAPVPLELRLEVTTMLLDLIDSMTITLSVVHEPVGQIRDEEP